MSLYHLLPEASWTWCQGVRCPPVGDLMTPSQQGPLVFQHWPEDVTLSWLDPKLPNSSTCPFTHLATDPKMLVTHDLTSPALTQYSSRFPSSYSYCKYCIFIKSESGGHSCQDWIQSILHDVPFLFEHFNFEHAGMSMTLSESWGRPCMEPKRFEGKDWPLLESLAPCSSGASHIHECRL